MADGIEINDLNGKLQFNGDVLTYALRLTGNTFSEARKVGNTCPNSFLIPTTNTYTQALIAISGGNGYASAYCSRVNQQRCYGTTAPVGTAFSYYIFERSNTIPASGFGLEVRNANNEITFSSSQRVMSVVDLIGGIVRDGEQSVTYPGRTLAYCQGAFSGHRVAGQVQYYSGGGGGGGVGGPIIVDDPDNPGAGTTMAWNNDGKLYGGAVGNGGQTVSSRMITYDDVRVGPTTTPPPDDWYQPLSLFVVDVTGITIGTQFY